jgi:hypothetical protein
MESVEIVRVIERKELQNLAASQLVVKSGESVRAMHISKSREPLRVIKIMRSKRQSASLRYMKSVTVLRV